VFPTESFDLDALAYIQRRRNRAFFVHSLETVSRVVATGVDYRELGRFSVLYFVHGFGMESDWDIRHYRRGE